MYGLKVILSLQRYAYIFLFMALMLCVSCSKKEDSEQKKKLRLNLYSEPPTLDISQATDATSMNVLLMLFDGLIRIGLDQRPHPALAETIHVSQDQLTYTFTMRTAFWSNGDPITAYDFLYSWKKILNPQSPAPFAYKLYTIKNALAIKNGELPIDALGVKVLDSKTLIVQLEHPASYFLEQLAFPTFYAVHQKTDETNPRWFEDQGPSFVNNGPFRLAKWAHNSELIVEKNPNYWDREAVHLEKIHFSMIDDLSTELNMFEMGELDWAGSPLSNLTSDVLPTLIQQNKVQTFPVIAVYYLKVNTERFPFTNHNIRKALALAINRQAIVEHVTQAGQKPACAYVPPMHAWNYTPLFQDGDTELAKILFQKGLDEEQLTREKFPPVQLIINTSQEHRKIAQVIQEQWQKTFAIPVKLESFDWKLYLSMMQKRDYQIARAGWVGDYHDPIAFLATFKYSDNSRLGGMNETGWENPAYRHLLDLSDYETDFEKRADLLHKAEAILMEEMPVIPIYFIKYNYLKKPYIYDVYLSPLGMMDFKYAYVEEE